MKLSLILAIFGAILVFLGIIIQLIIYETMTLGFMLLLLVGMLLLVVFFNYYMIIDTNIYKNIFKSFDIHANMGVDSPVVRYCPQCGRTIPVDSVICPYCNTKFSEHK